MRLQTFFSIQNPGNVFAHFRNNMITPPVSMLGHLCVLSRQSRILSFLHPSIERQQLFCLQHCQRNHSFLCSKKRVIDMFNSRPLLVPLLILFQDLQVKLAQITPCVFWNQSHGSRMPLQNICHAGCPLK